MVVAHTQVQPGGKLPHLEIQVREEVTQREELLKLPAITTHLLYHIESPPDQRSVAADVVIIVLREGSPVSSIDQEKHCLG